MTPSRNAPFVPESAEPPHGRAPIVGLGCAQLGNLYRAISNDEAGEIVDAAWASGVRHFDVAPHYGLGLAEERLGAALASHPRDEYVLSTKVGRLLIPNEQDPERRDDDLFEVPATFTRRYDYSRDGILRSLDASLGRLRTDRIDILYVHDPDAHYREALEGAFPALDELRRQHVIHSYGAGMNQSAMLADFVRNTDADVMMVAGRYTLLDQSADADLLPVAAERGVAIAAAGVFNSGILSSDAPDPKARFDYAPAAPEILQRANEISRICHRHDLTLPEAAAQFPFTAAAVQAIILGADSPQHAARDAHLVDRTAPVALWNELQESGLIRNSASTEDQGAHLPRSSR